MVEYNLIIDAGIGNGKLSEKQLRNFGVDEEVILLLIWQIIDNAKGY